MAVRLSPSSSGDASSSGSAGFIEHTVSKLDTLAGIAIKYGVEVADIKRMNGLVTDMQMFARNTLRIPLPGRHTPSAALASPPGRSGCSSSSTCPMFGKHHSSCSHDSSSRDGSYRATERRPVTSAMGLLRGYYGLSSMSTAGSEGREMAIYKSNKDFQTEDESFSRIVRGSEPVNTRYSSNRGGEVGSFAFAKESCNNFLDSSLGSNSGVQHAAADVSPLSRSSRDSMAKLEKAGDDGVGNDAEKGMKERSVRRRAKVEGIGDEVSSRQDIAAAGERVAASWRASVPRPKVTPKAGAEAEANCPTPWPGPFASSNGWHNCNEVVLGGSGSKGLGTTLLGGMGSKIRRSSSVSSLQEEGKSKGDSLALPLASQGPLQSGSRSSVLEGLATIARRTKAALD